MPAWTEVAISAGIVSAAVLVFLFIVEHFKVWEQRPADPDADPLKLPEFDPVGTTWLGAPGSRGAHHVFAGASSWRRRSASRFLRRSRRRAAASSRRRFTRRGAATYSWIDGNLDGFGVAFKHEEHEKREGGKASCVKCHHMNLPRDENYGLLRCHYATCICH